jgi:hypothetical protein
MAPNELPPRPSLEQLRKRAKDLLKAARSEEAAAIARLQKQLSGHAARVQLADALNVIAREYGFPSWAKLKAYVETVRSTTVEVVQPPLVPAEIARRFRRRGPRQMPSRRYIQELHAAVVQAATQNGMPFPFIFAPPLGPLTAAVQLPLREALVASGDHPLIVDVLLAHERCASVLLRLAEDPVPRVRWFAIHSLACDDCKLAPLPSCPDVIPLLVSRAKDDPSERVRRRALETLGLAAGVKRRLATRYFPRRRDRPSGRAWGEAQ